MSNLNQHTDRSPDGKLLRSKFRCHRGPRFPSSTPKWWRRLFMTARYVSNGCKSTRNRLTRGDRLDHASAGACSVSPSTDA